MYIPNPYFKNIPKIGNLSLDYIFVEDGYPVLFTCTSPNKKIYLCICRTLTPEQKWVLSEITVDALEKLINNDCNVRQTFKSKKDGYSCIIKWRKPQLLEDFEVISTEYLPDGELPDDSVFLDDEGAETYLKQVKHREESFRNSFMSGLEGFVKIKQVSYVRIENASYNFDALYRFSHIDLSYADSAAISNTEIFVEKSKTFKDLTGTGQCQDIRDNVSPAA